MEVGQRETRRRSALAQINVTPFVDVMLVLLVIFMVTAPMMEQGLDVNLPEVAESPTLEQLKEPVTVSVQRDGSISIGRSKVEELEKLGPVLLQVLKQREEKQVLLEADRDVPYGRVVQVMAAIQRTGITKVGMVTKPPEK